MGARSASLASAILTGDWCVPVLQVANSGERSPQWSGPSPPEYPQCGAWDACSWAVAGCAATSSAPMTSKSITILVRRVLMAGSPLKEGCVASHFAKESSISRVLGMALARRLTGSAGGSTVNFSLEAAMAAKCGHLNQIKPVKPSADGCEECLKTGDTWVHLRECLFCGHVGCCDSSKNKHATKHFRATHHPIIQSFEPGEDWKWCYIDQIEL